MNNPVRVMRREFTMMEKKFTTDHLIGECHINFETLLNGIISMGNADDSEKVIFGESSTKDFSEKLWYCGHQVGSVSGQIILENMPFLS